MKYDFIFENKDNFTLQRMCQTFNIKPSAYFAYIRRGPSNRALEDKGILEDIRKIRKGKFKSRAGAPLLTQELKKKGKHHGQKRIQRIMRENALYGGRKRKHKYKKYPSKDIQNAENKLNRDFSPSKPNEKWCSDITYIKLFSGWAYLCVVIDLYSKYIVGWSLSKNPDSALTIAAVKDAFDNRSPGQNVLMHSDRGCQYTSEEFIGVLGKYQMIQSLSRRGNCWDNACNESFFGHLKLEALGNKTYKNIEEVLAVLTEYIDIYYNKYRLHSSNDYQAPAEKEKKCA